MFVFDFDLMEVRRKDSDDEYSDENGQTPDEDEETVDRNAVAVGGLTAASSSAMPESYNPPMMFTPAVVPTKIVRKQEEVPAEPPLKKKRVHFEDESADTELATINRHDLSSDDDINTSGSGSEEEVSDIHVNL